MAVLLTRKAVVRAAVESQYGVAATLGNGDGVLISKPQYNVKPNVLERDFVRNDLSPMAHIIGRKLASMEFETELRGNGRSNSGLLADLPIIGRLLRACGYAATAHAASSMLGPFVVSNDPVGVSWSSSVAGATNTDFVSYFVKVTTGGPSGVAQVTISSDTNGEGSAPAAITSATPITLGAQGATITPTWTGNLVQGQEWVVWLLPPGTTLQPVSENFESLTLEMHRDGVKHLMPGCFGTFEITAQAGNFANIKWNFTGAFNTPTDDANPTPTFETAIPSQIELARLHLDSFQPVVEKFTFNQHNDIQIRPDVSSTDGYIGARIVGRKPEGGIDPEADLVANYDFWGKFAAASRIPFQMRAGSAAGNTVWMLAPSTQYSGMTYTDRQGILAYDAGLKFSRVNGNDEFFFHFC
jgi:hypothetical protein